MAGSSGSVRMVGGLATVKKHTGREGVFCCEFHGKAQHEKYLGVLIWCCLRRWLGSGLGVVEVGTTLLGRMVSSGHKSLVLDAEVMDSAAGDQSRGRPKSPGMGEPGSSSISLNSPSKKKRISQPPRIFKNKQKHRGANLLLFFLLALYGDINKLLFHLRMPSFYWVLVFYLRLKKLHYNEQGIPMFLQGGKKPFKSVFKESIWEKRGGNATEK